jgi:short subunit dehydrogenase-like uncharacterized protein
MHHAQLIAVYGASGHTGRFVIDELRRRGLPTVAVGRDASKAVAGVPMRVAAVDDPVALEKAFAGCAVVINCAGPFLDTAAPVARAALAAGSSYIDVTAEQPSALATFEAFDEAARAAGATVIPAAGFYGGLADLLATALVGDEPVDELTVAIGLDRWWPTRGTRITGERNRAARMVIRDGRLAPWSAPSASTRWTFDAPLGPQEVVELPFSEVITIARHLKVANLNAYLTTASLQDLRDSSTPPPEAVDAQGRSAQQFVLEVVARQGSKTRRALARGRDIYAVTAPLVVEAAARLLSAQPHRRGALALGQAFDADDFLRAIAPAHLSVERPAP